MQHNVCVRRKAGRGATSDNKGWTLRTPSGLLMEKFTLSPTGRIIRTLQSSGGGTGYTPYSKKNLILSEYTSETHHLLEASPHRGGGLYACSMTCPTELAWRRGESSKDKEGRGEDVVFYSKYCFGGHKESKTATLETKEGRSYRLEGRTRSGHGRSPAKSTLLLESTNGQKPDRCTNKREGPTAPFNGDLHALARERGGSRAIRAVE